MANKVRFGLKELHVAFYDADSLTPPDWETPIAVPGSVGFKADPEGEENKFYADNATYYLSSSNDGYTAEVETALIPDAILAEMLGWEIDSNGMLVEIADGTPKRFALMFQVEGDARNRRSVYYDCQASRPSTEHKTKEKGVEPNTDTLKITIFPIDIDGNNVVKGVLERNDTNASVYNAFFDTVTLPSLAQVS